MNLKLKDKLIIGSIVLLFLLIDLLSSKGVK